ncbi:ATP-binding protein [Mucilaginibacter sp.]|uniref:sensor histidine kinase n=1 Tax=Mucilaginibacter sp. TaxID=1882438 RepID=UPI003B00CF7C
METTALNTSVKVRFLLLVLCVSLFLSALTVKMTSDTGNLLAGSALTLQKKLNDREAFVQDILSDPVQFKTLQRIDHDEKAALSLIQNITKNKKIYFCTYRQNKLNFWSSSRIVPDSSSAYKAGTSFTQENNGYYEVVKKTQGNFSVLFFIPVKTAYTLQNKYLQNRFSRQLLDNDYLDLVNTAGKQTYKITSLGQQTLFYVKLKAGYRNNYFTSLEIVLWGLSLLALFALAYNFCTYLVCKGYVKRAVLLAGLFVLACITVNFFLHALDYASGAKAMPLLQLKNVYVTYFSIGDIALIILFISWLATFVYSNRGRLLRSKVKPVLSYVLFVLMLFLLIGLSVVFSNLFSNLIIDSRIQFDIDNLLNLTAYNFLGTIMLCLSYLIFYLFAETCITVCQKLSISNQTKLLLFAVAIVLATLLHVYFCKEFTSFYLLWAAVVAWRAYNVFYEGGKMPAVVFILILFAASLIATLKLALIQKVLDKENGKLLVQKLANTTDTNAESIFKRAENNIKTDPVLVRYFSKPDRNEVYLKNHIRTMYFDDYLSKYKFKVYAYNNLRHNISGQQDYELDVFQNMVLLGSPQVKGTTGFYKVTDVFGERRYFALIPIKKGRELEGTLVIDLVSKSLETNPSFPQLLSGGSTAQQSNLKNYSYAFYRDNRLLNQNGKYEYNLINKQFKGKPNEYSFLETKDPGGDYNHEIYQLNARKLIVVSMEDKKLADELSVFIFFFVIFLFFALLVIAFYWFWNRIKTLNFNHFVWSLQVAANNLLYKTRIQVSMVASVVITLLIIGFVTFITFGRQDRKQQDDLNHEKIKQIAADYESQFVDSKITNPEERELHFSAFAETYGVDLILYNTQGVPLLYTQPKLYNYGLIGRRMNATAFVKMQRLQKSELLNDEDIGSFKYKSAYIAIYDAEHKVVDFLQLPYFSNEEQYKARIGYFINSMLNVYALVLVAVGLFAVFIAKKITNPLTLIQQGLTNTVYGRKTEPINWKRNDEIGSLIKEYNKMITSLELSAGKLAKSERENAWREMAKQIAHEIKNPLTPLKLGLQLLSKSWKDKDPKFDLKFQKFSLSFIEQIETLSRIATEFSDFAKLPDAKPEVVNIFDVISGAANIFSQSENMRIDYAPSDELYLIRADKDQLMRCFNNLLKNAIEAMPVNYKGVIAITYQSTDDNIRIEVKDNGSGIPENLRSSIFQPNFTTKSSGTGLGLAFIKNAIENAGGKIWFESEINVGTTFFLLFPAAPKNFL